MSNESSSIILITKIFYINTFNLTHSCYYLKTKIFNFKFCSILQYFEKHIIHHNLKQIYSKQISQ
jgi:hypothetical protein